MRLALWIVTSMGQALETFPVMQIWRIVFLRLPKWLFLFRLIEILILADAYLLTLHLLALFVEKRRCRYQATLTWSAGAYQVQLYKEALVAPSCFPSLGRYTYLLGVATAVGNQNRHRA